MSKTAWAESRLKQADQGDEMIKRFLVEAGVFDTANDLLDGKMDRGQPVSADSALARAAELCAGR